MPDQSERRPERTGAEAGPARLYALCAGVLLSLLGVLGFFYDAGFVNTDPYDFSPAEYNDNFGFGLRLFVAGAPLSLDFGIPLTGDKFNKKGSQFNFSFGTRF